MIREEILSSLGEILKTVRPAMDLSRVNENSSLVQDLGLDSLSMLLMSFAIENKFSVKFDMSQPFNTIADIVGYIEKNQKR